MMSISKINLNSEKHDGVLITFCGLDGCGKTTIINLLNEFLISEGINAILTKQPTNDLRNFSMFRNFMDCKDHTAYDYRALSLYAAGDRIQHTNKFIMPLLKEGKFVISDRYFYSCLANHRARGYNDSWIYEIAMYIQKPDFSFFLDVDVDTAISRVRKRESEKNKYIDVVLQHKLRDQYLQIAQECSGVVISSSGDVNDCFSEVLNHIRNVIYSERRVSCV